MKHCQTCNALIEKPTSPYQKRCDSCITEGVVTEEARKKAYHKAYYERRKEDPEIQERYKKATAKHQSTDTYRINQRKRVRAQRIRNSYGLTVAEYDALIASNPNCNICQVSLDKAHLDHCHKTNKVRGVLCTQCNIGLGMFKDSPEVLQRAIKYLE